jgi:hypothetical protein
MEIAGSQPNGVLDQAIDQHNNFYPLRGGFRLQIMNRVTHDNALLLFSANFESGPRLANKLGNLKSQRNVQVRFL